MSSSGSDSLSSSSTTSQSLGKSYLEELDTEFHCNIKTAKTLMKHLKRPKDREIASRLIGRVTSLTSDSLEVKSNRNDFTKYFLRVLKRTKETQPKEYGEWFRHDIEDAEETQLWSPDRRTFVATKTIPGFGMLAYLAVSYNPDLGWQERGFLSYDF